jgi:hypothetical protein
MKTLFGEMEHTLISSSVRAIENHPTRLTAPTSPILIAECGQVESLADLQSYESDVDSGELGKGSKKHHRKSERDGEGNVRR